MRDTHRTVCTLAAAALLLGCGDAPTAPEVSKRPAIAEPRPFTHLVVTPGAATIQSGQSLRLTAVATGVTGEAGALRTLSWESENGEIASVNRDGVVLGGRPGETRIRARYATALAVATVTVVKRSTPAAPCLVTIPSSGC